MLRRIQQVHENGCVPACVAMLTGLSYIQSCRIVHPYRRNWDRYGSTPENVNASLKRAGFKIRQRNVKKIINFSQLKRNALVVLAHEAYGPPGHNLHAVVWDVQRQKILDPYPSPQRHLKRHLPLKSYQKSTIKITEVY